MNKKIYTQPSATIVMLDLDSSVVMTSQYDNVEIEIDEDTDFKYDKNKTSIWDNAW